MPSLLRRTLFLPLLAPLAQPSVLALARPLNSPLLPLYDYIIVGGGPAGLTVAMRLSEDPATTVLLLEAGPADANEPEITVPGLIGEDIGGKYDWNLSTVPQTYLDGLPRSLPQGRVLGGGTVLNGMLWNRGGQDDYADWVALGNPGWSWQDLLPYFMRSETFTPLADPVLAEQFSVEADMGVHGTQGPVNVGFPAYFWNTSAVLFDALNELGVPTAYDPNTGLVAGASFLPLDIDPVSQTRADARRAYLDPYLDRENLWVVTEQTVTQIVFGDRSANPFASTVVPDGGTGSGNSPGVPFGIFGGTTTVNASHVLGSSSSTTTMTTSPPQRLLSRAREWLRRVLRRRQFGSPTLLLPELGLLATGVEFATDAQSPRQNVSAAREVIVAAGALHSPQLLMLSGIGPATHLQALDIPVTLDLPGVGQNLQDHGQVWAWYPYNNPAYPNPTELTNNEIFSQNAWMEFWGNRSGPLTAPAIDGVAFPALPYIVNGSTAIVNAAAAQFPEQYLIDDIDPTVLAGYTLQKELMTSALQDITRAAYELINANDGVLTIATMRPFSRGTITLDSPFPFSPPLIDPRYGSNPLDTTILRAAMAFNQRLCSTSGLSILEPVQVYPPTDASEEEIEQYIQTKWQTEYHPSGTCAMLPLELGGVVDSELKVYGTRNLRVVDSSVFPLLPAAHLQAVVYGVAEKAADIIKAANAATTSSSSASLSTSTTAPSTTSLLSTASPDSNESNSLSTLYSSFGTYQLPPQPAPTGTPGPWRNNTSSSLQSSFSTNATSPSQPSNDSTPAASRVAPSWIQPSSSALALSHTLPTGFLTSARPWMGSTNRRTLLSPSTVSSYMTMNSSSSVTEALRTYTTFVTVVCTKTIYVN